jgi:Holliday junction resolvase RusA-like endonuclease
MRIIEFYIYGVPVPEGRARFTKAGGTYTPAKTRAWKGLVNKAALEAFIESGMFDPLHGALTMSLDFTLPIPPSWSKRKQDRAAAQFLRPIGKPDVDNLAKAVMDGCNEVLYFDDAQIVALSIRKRYGLVPHVCIIIDEELP